jgi:oligopeptide/dipeptide ABC transporter ATP-binding protein
MEALPLLSIRDLRSYLRTPRGTVRAVDGVSFDLRAGETLGVVGETGCGKSVLARSIMGLLPDSVLVKESGEIRFGECDLRQASERELRSIRGREIAMIFQDPMTSLNPVMRVGAQIQQVLRLHLGFGVRQAQERAVELLDSVGIASARRRAASYPHEMSGGMRQRVMIAIALACDPKLLIADEPTTALDVTVQAQILNLLQEQQEKRRMALILITHNLGVVAGMADNVAVMYAGRFVEYGITSDLLAAPRMPYTAALLRAAPRLADPPHTKLEAIAGRPPILLDPPAGCRFAPRCPRSRKDCERDPPETFHSMSGRRFTCWHPIELSDG